MLTSPRLDALAAWVLPGKPVADIGCDHGLLLEILLRRGIVPSGIGVDLRPGPLAGARARLAGRPVELRLGDGLGPVRAGEVATAVIAGMHGEKMKLFLEKDGHRITRAVLGPHGGDELVRAALPGWCVVAEQVVEDGHLYPILVMERGAQERGWIFYGDPALHTDRAQLGARARADETRLGALARRTATSEARLREARAVLSWLEREGG